MLDYETSVLSLRDRVLDVLGKTKKRKKDPHSALGEYVLKELCSVRKKASVEELGTDDVIFLSHSLQSAVLELARRAEDQECSVMKMEGTQLFLDSVMDMAYSHSPPLDLSMPAMCLEILMEITTTMHCADIFDYLDSRMDMFTRPGVRQKSQYTLLRTCNIFLKRLSKSQDAELCGRVLIFLAKFLPLTERSGVNMYGSFHVDNMTPLEDVKEGDVDAEGNAIDVEFYKTFWGLQKWFADPGSALAPGAWDSIMESMKLLLKKFDSIKVTVTETSGSFGNPEENTGSSVKYLSSAGLLSLQIRDATFRRTILVQCLILIGWLENPLLKDFVSKKPTERVLSSIEYMKGKVCAQLSRTPEKGGTFANAIMNVLRGETAWSLWKQAGCPADPFQIQSSRNLEDLKSEKLGVEPTKLKKSSDAMYGIEIGVPELTRLWNLTEDNLSMLAADDRGGFKTLRQLMDPVIDEMNSTEDDDMLNVSGDQVYNWKTLRMVAKASLPVFAAAVKAGGDLKVVARSMYPDEVPVDIEDISIRARDGDGTKSSPEEDGQDEAVEEGQPSNADDKDMKSPEQSTPPEQREVEEQREEKEGSGNEDGDIVDDPEMDHKDEDKTAQISEEAVEIEKDKIQVD